MDSLRPLPGTARRMNRASDRPTGFGPRLRWCVWGLYLAAWTAALLTPQPVRAAAALLPRETAFLSAKTLHVTAYAVLAILTGWLRPRGGLRWLMLLFLPAHAMATEFFQQFVPSRTGSWMDVGLDCLGIAIGLLLSWRWWTLRRGPGR